MKDRLAKHIWLIQLNDPIPPISGLDYAGGASHRLSPCWDLLCLQSFINKRTGYTCDFIDTRLYHSPEHAFDAHEATHGACDIAILYASMPNIGICSGVASYLKQRLGDLKVLLAGPLLTSFPECMAQFPNDVYGMCGDAEQIMQHIMDFDRLQIMQKMIPGLLSNSQFNKSAAWLRDLNGLALPGREQVNWEAYRNRRSRKSLTIEVRISRGNPNTEDDMWCSVPGEPLRMWPLPEMVEFMLGCAGIGVSEVFFADPPGVWSDEHLWVWSHQLIDARNEQAWAFQCLPRDFPDEVFSALSASRCSRIELIVPTSSDNKLVAPGIRPSTKELKELCRRLRKNKLNPQFNYWIQGPGEPVGEAERIYNQLNSLSFPDFTVCPFPFHADSCLYRDVVDNITGTPSRWNWEEWARRPGENVPPVALWGGESKEDACRETIEKLKKMIARSPNYYIRMWRRTMLARLNLFAG
ncbi:MAG TPA: hypothetical protein PJ991_09820 [Kiritimatiellia bacterium]|nr:hypothetical protein [Kiritimatiellia bacterium]